MNAALAAGPEVATLAHFPDSITDLPAPHRVILALVVARAEATGEAIAWHELVDSAIVAIAAPDFPEAHELPRRNILRNMTSVVGDLFDYGLLERTPNGLSLSERAEKARSGWNGEFSKLVDRAKNTAMFVH